MSVYDERGNYTELALILKEDTSNVIHKLIKKYVNSELSLEAIEYVMQEAIHTDLIRAKYMCSKCTKNFASDLDGQ